MTAASETETFLKACHAKHHGCTPQANDLREKTYMKKSDHWHKSMYDHYFASTTIGSKRFKELAKKEVDFLVSKLGLRQGDRVLDVTGVDISDACLKLARLKKRNRNVTLRSGNMVQLSSHRGKIE